MPYFYYLILWKNYLEKENTWELVLAVMHFQKLINIFFKEHLKKLIVISPFLDSTLLMTSLLVSKKLKQKRDYPSKRDKKKAEIKVLGSSLR